MRGYELCLILQPEISDDDLTKIIDTLTGTIDKLQGSLVKVEKWGKKLLKFSIKKKTKGIFCFILYKGNPEILKEIDRLIRFDESILRYTNVLLPKDYVYEVAKVVEPVEAAPQVSEPTAGVTEPASETITESAPAPEPQD